MSEAMNRRSKASRFYLLTTVSSIALISPVFGIGPALAAGQESGVWVEMGASSDRVNDSNSDFAFPIGGLIPPDGLTGPLTGALNLSRSASENGKLTFRPGESDWVFSAAVTYGRSQGKSRLNQQQPLPSTTFVTFHTTIPTYPFPYHKTHIKHVHASGNSLTATSSNTESHFVIDFSAGKDVGLGLFGRDSTSVFSAGVRYANFTTKLNMPQIRGVTDVHFTEVNHTIPTFAFFRSIGVTEIVPWYHTSRSQIWHDVNGSGKSSHNFSGLGPSISWEASVPLIGNKDHGGEFLLDWGVNAAVLFGKQKNKVEHRSSSSYNCYGKICGAAYKLYAPQSGAARTSKNVTVPNLGGFAGVSYSVSNFKASFGYKADYFFRAIDTGVAGQHAVTRSFQGPFASITVGIGD